MNAVHMPGAVSVRFPVWPPGKNVNVSPHAIVRIPAFVWFSNVIVVPGEYGTAEFGGIVNVRAEVSDDGCWMQPPPSDNTAVYAMLCVLIGITVGPAGPLGPVGPPLGPVGPVNVPVGPVTPEGPVLPVGPV